MVSDQYSPAASKSFKSLSSVPTPQVIRSITVRFPLVPFFTALTPVLRAWYEKARSTGTRRLRPEPPHSDADRDLGNIQHIHALWTLLCYRALTLALPATAVIRRLRQLPYPLPTYLPSSPISQPPHTAGLTSPSMPGHASSFWMASGARRGLSLATTDIPTGDTQAARMYRVQEVA